MNYMTGLMMGASIGKFLQSGLRGDVFEPIHLMPGRRRYFHGRLKNNPNFAEELCLYFSGLPEIIKAEANFVTGTLVLVHGWPEEKMDRLLAVLNDKWRRGTVHHRGAVGQNIRGVFGKADLMINQKTMGFLDLKTCAALLLAWGGAQKVMQRGDRPSGPQMLWWAYGLLKGGKA